MSRTKVFILLPKGVRFNPEKDEQYDAGTIEGLDFKDIPAARLVEVTSANAKRFKALAGRAWDDDNGDTACSILLAHHTEDLRHIGLAAFALSAIPKDTIFPYAGDMLPAKEVDSRYDREFIKIKGDKVVSPAKRCNFAMYAQWLPSAQAIDQYELPKGEQSTIAIGNLISGGLPGGRVGVQATAFIAPGTLLGWSYNQDAEQRQPYWEQELRADAGTRLSYFTTLGLPIKLSFKAGAFAPMIVLTPGSANNQFLFGNCVPYDLTMMEAIYFSQQQDLRFMACSLACGTAAITVNGLRQQAKKAITTGQFSFRVTALLTNPNFIINQDFFSEVKKNYPFFKPGKFIRDAVPVSEGDKITLTLLVDRLHQAIKEDDFDTFMVLLVSYKTPSVLKRLLTLTTGDNKETLLQASVRYHRGSMYACLCSAYYQLYAKNPKTPARIDCGPLEGNIKSPGKNEQARTLHRYFSAEHPNPEPDAEADALAECKL